MQRKAKTGKMNTASGQSAQNKPVFLRHNIICYRTLAISPGNSDTSVTNPQGNLEGCDSRHESAGAKSLLSGELRNPVVKAISSSLKIQGRTPRSFLKAVARRLSDAVLYHSETREQSEQYRFAMRVIHAVRDGERNPYGYVLAHYYGGNAPKLKIKPAVMRGTPDTWAAAHFAQSVVPSIVDGRTGAEWLASVMGYLEWQVSKLPRMPIADLRRNSYYGARAFVNAAMNAPEFPAEIRREKPATISTLETATEPARNYEPGELLA
jgi:hypothetical protein